MLVHLRKATIAKVYAAADRIIYTSPFRARALNYERQFLSAGTVTCKISQGTVGGRGVGKGVVCVPWCQKRARGLNLVDNHFDWTGARYVDCSNNVKAIKNPPIMILTSPIYLSFALVKSTFVWHLCGHGHWRETNSELSRLKFRLL